MGKLLIAYFSGTGNTAYVASLLGQRLSSSFEVVLREMTEVTEDDVGKADCLGLGFPVHAFNAPEVFYRWVKGLKNVRGKKVFAFSTSGEGLRQNDVPFSYLAALLKRKGAVLISARRYVMPYDIIFRVEEAMASTMVRYAGLLSAYQAAEIARMEEFAVPRNTLRRIVSFLFRIEWPYARFQGKRMKVDENGCSRCGLCASNCPVGNIRLEEGKVVFSRKCTMCMRCVMNCPRDCIRLFLLDSWRVNGSYDYRKLANGDYPFPCLSRKTKHAWLYYSYYRDLDELLGRY